MKTQIINAITKKTEVREMTSEEEKAHEELISKSTIYKKLQLREQLENEF